MRICEHSGFVRDILRKFSALLVIATLLLAPSKAKATDILGAIASITCVTSGLGDVLTKPYSHTCTPEAFSTIAIATIISPLYYLPMMLKLKVGFDEVTALKGNCLRTNRASPNNPTLTFAMCSDMQLFAYRGELLGKAIYTGDFDSLSELMNYNKFHDVYHDKSPGDNGIFYDIPLLASPLIPYEVFAHNDRICVGTYTLWGSLLAVGCKYIREPYPQGIYKQFFETGIPTGGEAYSNILNVTIPADAKVFVNCATGVGGCAQNATRHSQTMLPLSSIIIECIRSTLLSTLISDTTCGVSNGNITYGGSLFHTFQKNMQRAVMALLTLYVMFTGFKLILGQGEVPPVGELVMYAVKLILVIYFSVGININKGGTFDGMVQWVFPLLLEMANEMASWVANATPSKLCVFPIEGISYTDGMGRLALWDTLDCKVMHYLGFDTLSSMFLGSAAGDDFGNSVPPYVFLLIPALISGQINLVMLALSYPLVVMSVAAYLVTTFAVCLIAITVLAVLAPIYVPFALFKQTEGYFQAWYQLMISFTLQPVVIVGFMTLMFAVFDQGFYTDCEFEGVQVKTRVLQTNVTKQTYILQLDKSKYLGYKDGHSEKYDTCTSSLGWILNQPLASLANKHVDNGQGFQKVIKVPPPPMGYDDYKAAYGVLSGVQQVSGIFFGYVALIGGINKQMIVSLFACILMLYLMRELSGQLSEFAADISSGVSLKGVTISPRSITGDKLKQKLEDRQDNKKAQDLAKREGALNGAGGDTKPQGGSRGNGSDSTAPQSSSGSGGGSDSTTPKASGGSSGSSSPLKGESEA